MKYESVNEAGVRDGTNDLPMSAASTFGEEGEGGKWSLVGNQSIIIRL